MELYSKLTWKLMLIHSIISSNAQTDPIEKKKKRFSIVARPLQKPFPMIFCLAKYVKTIDWTRRLKVK